MSRPRLSAVQEERRSRARHVQIILTPTAGEGLAELVRTLDAASQSEGIRTAILLALRIVRETARGSRLTVTRRDGSSYEVLVPVPEERP